MSTPPESHPKAQVLFSEELTSFELIRSLGMRANGELLLARRCYDNVPGVPVLIKRLADPTNAYARARLLEELRVLLLLKHPVIAQVLLVRHHEGSPHLVMEYAEGSTLEGLINCAAIRGWPLSESFAAYVLAEVAEALHHAHTLCDAQGRPLGIIHRDLSPRTIVLSPEGRVKLTEFAAAWSRMEGRLVTDSPLLRGDIAYASPEALQQLPLDARSDVFSLGVVLLELLTNKHLLDLEEVESVARGAGPMALPRLSSEESSWLPAPEMARRMACLRSEHVERATQALTQPMRALARRALCQEPRGRFQTALELRDALRAFLDGQGRCYGPPDAQREASEARARAATMANIMVGVDRRSVEEQEPPPEES